MKLTDFRVFALHLSYDCITLLLMAKTSQLVVRIEEGQQGQLDALSARLGVNRSEATRIALWTGLTALQGNYTGGAPDFLNVFLKLMSSVQGDLANNPHQLALFHELIKQIDTTPITGDSA